MTEGWDIAPGLIELAERWATYEDSTMRACQQLPNAPRCELWHDAGGRHRAMVTRCRDCSEEIYPVDQIGTLRHLLTSHGYRMDGRQFNNQNQQVSSV